MSPLFPPWAGSHKGEIGFVLLAKWFGDKQLKR